MTTITEDYVSFETAKLLKEKGFDEELYMIYTSYRELQKLRRYGVIRNSSYNGITKNYFEYTAPTLQMACKWLREVHNLGIAVVSNKQKWGYSIYNILDDDLYAENIDVTYLSYEDACEAAIKYCLNILI